MPGHPSELRVVQRRLPARQVPAAQGHQGHQQARRLPGFGGQGGQELVVLLDKLTGVYIFPKIIFSPPPFNVLYLFKVCENMHTCAGCTALYSTVHSVLYGVL